MCLKNWSDGIVLHSDNKQIADSRLKYNSPATYLERSFRHEIYKPSCKIPPTVAIVRSRHNIQFQLFAAGGCLRLEVFS